MEITIAYWPPWTIVHKRPLGRSYQPLWTSIYKRLLRLLYIYRPHGQNAKGKSLQSLQVIFDREARCYNRYM